MPIKEKINSDFLEAYKARRDTDVSILRMLKSSIQNAEIAQKSPLDDTAILKLLSREVKQREQSLAEYRKASRNDLADKELFEINFIKSYLPEQLSDVEISLIIDSVVSETGATSISDLGRVMPIVMLKVAGRADGGIVSKIVREKLQ